MNYPNKKGPQAALSKTKKQTLESGLGFPNLFPTTALSGIQYSFANVLGFQCISEVRAQGTLFAGSVSFDKVSELIDKAVLVSDVESGNPPFVHVWVLASIVGYVNGAPTSGLGIFLVVLVVLEPVKVV